MASELEMKRIVARELLIKAGDLVEFWDGPDEVPAWFVRKCLARWLGKLPGDYWDTRLGEIEGA